MEYGNINILIVDDDDLMRVSLSEALTRVGFKVVVAAQAQDALKLVKMQRVHFAIIDCMLPGQNGADLGFDLRNLMTPSDKIFFITGIYKDKVFARDVLSRTGGEKFFYKPFNVDEIVNTIKEAVDQKSATVQSSSNIDEDLHSLIFTLKKLSVESLTAALGVTPNMVGFDLSILIPSLMLQKGTGQLDLVTTRGNITIEFVKGKIRSFQSDGSEQRFSQLLVEQGYISQEEYNEFYTQMGDDHFESALLEKSIASPHVIIAMKGQQVLSELEPVINEESLSASFTPQEESDEKFPCDIEYTDIRASLCEVVEFQLSDEWIKNLYAKHLDDILVLNVGVGDNHPVFQYPVTQRIENLFDVLSKSPKLKDILRMSGNENIRNIFYKALYVLMTHQLIVFIDTKSKNKNLDESAEAFSQLKTLFHEIKNWDL